MSDDKLAKNLLLERTCHNCKYISDTIIKNNNHKIDFMSVCKFAKESDGKWYDEYLSIPDILICENWEEQE